jgi:cell division protein FtsQ
MKFGYGQQRQGLKKNAVSQQRTARGQTERTMRGQAERTKQLTRGASRTAPQPKGKKFDVKGFGNKLLRWLGYTSVVGLVAVIGYGTVTWASGQLDRPVNSVKINGEFTRISQKEVAEIIYDAMGSSFMKLDLEDIQQRLEDQAWIDRARVARRWPDQLEVTVIEHKPIARWGKADVLNHRGEVIRLSGESAAEELLQGLPELDGLEGMEQAMMAQYQVLNKMLMEHGLEVKQLVCNASRSWTITLSDGVIIRIGRDQMMAKMRRFLLVYKAQLQAQWADLTSIDLRYYNGVAVQWRQSKSA